MITFFSYNDLYHSVRRVYIYIIIKVQFNEVPLINSIKHVRYVEPQANECDNLA